MSPEQIIESWKDEDIWLSSTPNPFLPDHPAGALEMTNELLDRLQGAQAADQLSLQSQYSTYTTWFWDCSYMLCTVGCTYGCDCC
jgi:mersacidin/lichenicidin family type 2 lantibiotic